MIMRHSIFLLASGLLLSLLSLPNQVQASDPPASDHSAPAASAHEDAPAKEAAPKETAAKDSATKDGVAKEAAKPPVLSSAAANARYESTADDLSVKIATRLAALRAAKAARAVQAAKKTALARKKAAAHGATPEAKHEIHWAYHGEEGPQRWGKLNPAWNKCETGNRQSPIDIRDGIKLALEPVNFDYRAASFNVVDNGHTIQVNVGGGNRISVMGRNYDLVQFHFHRPSEERIDGKGFEMVAHLVHKDSDGKLAVVAVLIERGRANALIQTVWNNLPLEKNDTVMASGTLDLSEFLPMRRDYFTYMGSLTTPPCSEGVLWMVMKEPVQVSSEQIGIFSRLYPMNARPVQVGFGRMIKESN